MAYFYLFAVLEILNISYCFVPLKFETN